MKDKTLKDILSALQLVSKQKTSAYDTTATVRRVEDGTAWVHIPGGVDETPVKLTINAKAGDTVQVRVSGGRAFMVGNASAPPTDDHVANQAVRAIKKTNKVVEAVSALVQSTKVIAQSAKTVAEEGKAIAEATNQYFWNDDNGAHVTTVSQDTDPTGTTGVNALWNTLGLLLRNGANILSQFAQGAVSFYDGEGNEAENVTASFGKTGAFIGSIGNNMLELNGIGLTGYDADNETFSVQFANATGHAEITERGNTIVNENVDTRQFADIVVNPVNDPVDGTDMLFEVSITADVRAGRKVGKISITRPYDTTQSTSINHTYEYRFYYDSSYYNRVQFTCKYKPNTKSISLTDWNIDLYCGIVSAQINTALIVDVPTTPSYTFGTRTEDRTEYGAYSFSSGHGNSAKGVCAQAHGQGVIASSDAQTAVGKYNAEDANDVYAFIVGNGANDSNRSNAFAVKWDGSVVAGGVTSYTPTWETGQAPENSHCVVSAGICSLSYQGQTTTHTTNTLLGTLPAEIRPPSDAFCPFVKNGVAYGTIRIESTGGIYVGFISSTTASGRVYFNCTFPVV